MKLNFQWKEQTKQYSNGYDLYLNRIKIGWSAWNDMMSRDAPDRDLTQYVGGTIFSDRRWYGATDEEVRHKVESYVTSWFEEALKDSKDNKDELQK